MRRVKLNASGCSANFNHIVSVERKKDWIIARLVSGTTVLLEDVYPVVFDLFQVGKDTWVNPVHVSVVDVAYNKDEAFRDVMAGNAVGDKDYMQVRVETLLGEKHTLWADLYTLDELDYLAELLDQEN